MVDRTIRYTVLAAVISILSIVVSLLFASNFVTTTSVQIAFGVITAIGVGVALSSSMEALRKYPSSLQILLIGPPGAGKTVFLTILFRQLETGKVGNLIFAPFGEETTSRVARNITRLASGEFPEPTAPGSFDAYEAVARFGGPFGRHYRIHVFDSAGEYLANIVDRSLSQDALLRLILHGDAVIMMVDCERILEADGPSLARLETSLIATLNAMIEKRTENPTLPFAVPVALVFSKADVAWAGTQADGEADGEASVLRRFENLIAVADRRCLRFKYFFSSSLGIRPGPGREPPQPLQPVKVTDPLMWILRG